MNYKQAFDNLRTESNCRHAICGDKNCHECPYHLGEGVLIESIDTILRGYIRCGQCEFFKKVGIEYICQNVNSKARKVDADYGCILAERRTDA